MRLDRRRERICVGRAPPLSRSADSATGPTRLNVPEPFTRHKLEVQRAHPAHAVHKRSFACVTFPPAIKRAPIRDIRVTEACVARARSKHRRARGALRAHAEGCRLHRPGIRCKRGRRRRLQQAGGGIRRQRSRRARRNASLLATSRCSGSRHSLCPSLRSVQGKHRCSCRQLTTPADVVVQSPLIGAGKPLVCALVTRAAGTKEEGQPHGCPDHTRRNSFPRSSHRSMPHSPPHSISSPNHRSAHWFTAAGFRSVAPSVSHNQLLNKILARLRKHWRRAACARHKAAMPPATASSPSNRRLRSPERSA